jgi:type II restriction/modification system DNA methylase subunit YeeA
MRYFEEGYIFDVAGCSIFAKDKVELATLLGFTNSPVAVSMLASTSPTLNFEAGQLAQLPIFEHCFEKGFHQKATQLISGAKSDWDAYETSWDFTTLPLLSPDHRGETLEATFARLRAHWQGMTDEMQRLEEENNRIFIDAYGLQDELNPEVPIEEITLTCNPAYRYGVKTSEEEREKRLLADTMAEFLSYAVGCMFGRYSLDASGLILANQGETLADYLARVPNPSFLPDKDNVIPVLEGDWFADDIVDRFRRFLRVSFGEAHFRDNIAFVEAQIGDIRKYFTKAFYEDHVKRYKKRPIYWMFSSPKGTFQALIYMHRYRPDTVSVLLNDYLREFIRKLGGERTRLEKLADDTSASQSQRTRALKDVSTVTKQIAELEEWEREVIFPLAQAKIEIDLDDGVKRNYPKFGAALKTIKGLEEADE